MSHGVAATAGHLASNGGCIDHGQVGDADGYGKTTRVIDGRRCYVRLHRAVFFDTYHYWPECVRHSCDNPRCINPSHLVGGTHADNMRDKAERHRSADVSGENNPSCKLTDAQVEEVRSRRKESITKLSKEFGVCRRHIYRIIAGERR